MKDCPCKGARAIRQISFSDAEQADKRMKTRREVFLAELELVVPWKAMFKVIEPTIQWQAEALVPTLCTPCCART